MNGFIFWVLLIAFGFAIIRIMYYVLLNLSKMVIKQIVKICPYKAFALWTTGITCAICASIFIYGIYVDVSSISTGIVATVMAIMALLLAFVLYSSTKEKMQVRDIMNETGMTEKQVYELVKEIE
ncbi:small-conductance mechanosensitive channel [Pedobacter sp. AK013]|uniref:hypothetical protein n=1 Tax=Pedobacter sp. AK013 TaxID=2723071 RepID=UPI00161FFB2C|nr:hypothetical protein [Pedobacter sp. AK013]MBB6240130.1 small-conductance mechanosensitive channel [Pedobacter sp. AK013]